MVEHPSKYKLVKLGSSIGIIFETDVIIDLAKQPGQATVGTLRDVFGEFETIKRRKVDPLLHPPTGVEVNPGRLGGWPTIAGTRIPFDLVAGLISDGTVPPERVKEFYPGVSPDAARDALDYDLSIKGEAA